MKSEIWFFKKYRSIKCKKLLEIFAFFLFTFLHYQKIILKKERKKKEN